MAGACTPLVGIEPASETERAVIYRKIGLRLIPMVFLCYVLNYIDRVNVSFAKLTFQSDIGLSDASYGFGVGIFYVGYILFEVPSNLLLGRIGARKTLTRIMCLWGLVSCSMAFVTSPGTFYLARVLLGAAEAGFFPGIVLYLTFWFPHRLRGRVMSLFVLAIAVSGIVGGPASGWIIQNLAGAAGFKGWQWLFLVEGALPVLVGTGAFFVLCDRPADAAWLTPREKTIVAADLSSGNVEPAHAPARAFLSALRNPKLWIATFGYFSITWAGTVLNFWAPTIIQRSGVADVFNVGLLSAVPYSVGAVGMLLLCRSSDRRLERRWHFALAAFLAATAALSISIVAQNVAAAITCLALLAMGYLSATALFWTIPVRFLSETEAVGSLAFISSMGQVGSLTAPIAFGFLASQTGGLTASTGLVAFVLTAGGMAILSLRDLRSVAGPLPSKQSHTRSDFGTRS